jgi:aspartyl-tRNA(Asn)/glutamyl-tRNA(Gln) amidotransferase subunit A
MIERPQDYGPQVLMRLQNGLAIPGVSYLGAMRWRGPALAAYLASRGCIDVRRWRRSRPHHRRRRHQPHAEAVIQRLTRVTA